MSIKYAPQRKQYVFKPDAFADALDRLGINRAQLARRADRDPGYLTRILSGKQPMRDLRVAQAFAGAAQMTVEELFDVIEAEPAAAPALAA